MGKKILVTGADGFIGSHLTEALVRAGHDVRAFVLYNSFNSWGWLDHADEDIKRSLDIFAGDIRDPNGVRQAVKGCDAVLHLASLIAIPFSYHSPDSYVQTNVTGTLNVLQAVRDAGVARMVHTSTSETYGTARFVPMTEEHPLIGQSPYSATKIAADQMAIAFHRSFATPVTVLRPFNTFGPRQSARAVIPTIISQLLAGNSRVRLGALTPTRDFTYVGETVRAFMAAMDAPNIEGEVINAGSGFEISIGDVARLIAELCGRPIEIECEDVRLRPAASEVDRLFADASKARRLMGWAPEPGGLEGFRQGMAKTVEWFADPTNLARYKTGIYNI